MIFGTIYLAIIKYLELTRIAYIIQIITLFLICLDDKISVYGEWSRDYDFVTKGLLEFTNNFMSQHLMASFILKKEISGPNTHVIGFNLQKMRKKCFTHELYKGY